MNIGKLYSLDDEQFVVGIKYDFHSESVTSWWGEFVLMEYIRLGGISNGDRYVIELEDGRKGRCSIKKRVNRAYSGVPPLYRYYFRGSGRLEKATK